MPVEEIEENPHHILQSLKSWDDDRDISRAYQQLEMALSNEMTEPVSQSFLKTTGSQQDVLHSEAWLTKYVSDSITGFFFCRK